MSREAHELSHRAYTVIKREGQDDFWLAIGAAFPHQSGDGMNLILQALPLPGADGTCKIVLRPPRDDQQQEDQPAERDRSSRKSGQQRR